MPPLPISGGKAEAGGSWCALYPFLPCHLLPPSACMPNACPRLSVPPQVPPISCSLHLLLSASSPPAARHHLHCTTALVLCTLRAWSIWLSQAVVSVLALGEEACDIGENVWYEGEHRVAGELLKLSTFLPQPFPPYQVSFTLLPEPAPAPVSQRHRCCLPWTGTTL